MVPDDIPEADAAEQARDVGTPPTPEHPHLGDDVPEADAIEQAQPVPWDEEADEPR